MSGTATMKPSELMKVIKCCGENNVKKLQVGDICIEFDPIHCGNGKLEGNQEESTGVHSHFDTDVEETPLFDGSEDFSEEDFNAFQDEQDLVLSDWVAYEEQVQDALNNSGDE